MKTREQETEEVFVGFASIMFASATGNNRALEDAPDCYDAAQSLWREHRKRYPEAEE